MSAAALSLRPAARPNGFGTILMDREGMVGPMTEPTEILREEHEVIQHLLHVLAAMAERVDRGESVARTDVDDVLEVVVKFADECHHAKEEKALFPALRRGSPGDGRPSGRSGVSTKPVRRGMNGCACAWQRWRRPRRPMSGW